MAYAKLKKMLMKMDLEDDVVHNQMYANNLTTIEVFADSLQEALLMASAELNLGMDTLDYEILKKGNSGFWGWGRLPYHIKIYRSKDSNRYKDIEDLHVSLSGLDNDEKKTEQEGLLVSKDAKSIVRIYQEGVFLKIAPPQGDGQGIDAATVHDKIRRSGIFNYSKGLVDKEIKKLSGTFVKIADYIPSPDPSVDSSASIELSSDEMKATVTITSPRPTGKHLKLEEILKLLKNSSITYGINEEKLEESLEEDRFYQPIVIAEGDPPQNGEDGFIEFRVRTEKKVEFEEDERGKIDFYQKDLIENVVEGQVLAERTPPQKGTNGKTVTGKPLEALDGKVAEFKYGKGVVESEDGSQLLAEYNGQVVFTVGRISVEEILRVDGDVGLTTGNITFLGSVIVRGSVTDNMEVKAAGNIEVATSVEKASMEAEGDIIIRQGVQGRDGALLESSGGSIFAKFVQNARLVAEQDIIVDEGIMHCNAYAGGSIICKGKRAQIVGGEIMAGKEIRVKQLGAQSSPPTSVIVGTNPKFLKQLKSLEENENLAVDKMTKLKQNIRTLTLQKTTQRDDFPPAKEDMLVKMLSLEEKLQEKLSELNKDKIRLSEYIEKMAKSGKVHVEKTLFPGVRVEINGAVLDIRDEYSHITLVEENKMIRIQPFEAPKKDKQKAHSKR